MEQPVDEAAMRRLAAQLREELRQSDADLRDYAGWERLDSHHRDFDPEATERAKNRAQF